METNLPNNSNYEIKVKHTNSKYCRFCIIHEIPKLIKDNYFPGKVLEKINSHSYQSRISRAERLFNYDVIDSHAVGCNSNKQNDPIDDALRGHHALASLPAGI